MHRFESLPTPHRATEIDVPFRPTSPPPPHVDVGQGTGSRWGWLGRGEGERGDGPPNQTHAVAVLALVHGMFRHSRRVRPIVTCSFLPPSSHPHLVTRGTHTRRGIRSAAGSWWCDKMDRERRPIYLAQWFSNHPYHRSRATANDVQSGRSL